jgi:uncharacterized protein
LPVPLHIGAAFFLFFVAVLAGAMNAVAGGGSFIGFPALWHVGVPPVSANATNTIALWTGVTASSGAYRKRLEVSQRVLFPLLAASAVGGAIGALLLLGTPAETFMRIIPWLMLVSTLLFLFGRRIAGGRPAIGKNSTAKAIVMAALLELVLASYGGYFGGGVGIVNLALFTALGMTDIHAMNALKVLLGTVINGVAVITFVVARVIYWPQAIVMVLGAVTGGYFAAHYAQKLPPAWVRAFVVLIGFAMTAFFFVQAYGG